LVPSKLHESTEKNRSRLDGNGLNLGDCHRFRLPIWECAAVMACGTNDSTMAMKISAGTLSVQQGEVPGAYRRQDFKAVT